MTNTQALGCFSSVSSFVRRIVGSADCKGSNIATQLLHGPTDETRVDTTTQECTNRYIGKETSFNGAYKEPLDLFNGFTQTWVVNVDGTGGLQYSRVCSLPFDHSTTRRCFHLLSATIDCALVSHIAKLEKLRQC